MSSWKRESWNIWIVQLITPHSRSEGHPQGSGGVFLGAVWHYPHTFCVCSIPRNTGTGTGSVPVPIFWNNPYWFLTCTHFMKIKMSPYPFRTNISLQPVPVPSPYSHFSKQTRTRTKMCWFYYVSVNPYLHSHEIIINLLTAERIGIDIYKFVCLVGTAWSVPCRPIGGDINFT